MNIKIYPNGIYGATTYLLEDENSKDAVLIDCTSSIEEFSKEIKKKKLNLKYILITHGHFDHVFCIAKTKEIFPMAQVLLHKNDIDLLKKLPVQCSMSGIEEIKIPCIDGLIDEKTHGLKIGKDDIKIIHTPGHTKGGVCYLIRETLFSGDTLFKESVGRCDLWGGNYTEIEQSIKEKLYKLDDNIIVYPGHGDKTTISHEKKYNSYITY